MGCFTPVKLAEKNFVAMGDAVLKSTASSICNQQILRSASASRQSDQNHWCSQVVYGAQTANSTTDQTMQKHWLILEFADCWSQCHFVGLLT